ncbi:MAG: DUF3553 domain-containing protein [Rhodospirillaceae bacterium]
MTSPRTFINPLIVPGAWVRHPACPEWGLGQVQSAVGSRVTVNFENAGKRLVITDTVRLDVLSDAEMDRTFGRS